MELREELRTAGVTHERLAARAGIERSNVTKQLGGERRLVPEVQAAARALLREARAERLMEAAQACVELAEALSG